MPDTPGKDEIQPLLEAATENNASGKDNENSQNTEAIESSSQDQIDSNVDLSNIEKQEETSSLTNVTRRRYKRINRPLYYIGGNNGTHIIDEFLSSLGWERTLDKSRDDYKLKWCEIKSHNNYYSFKEGEQLCYQISNNKVLTTKIGLLTSLQEYDRVMFKVKKGKPRILNYQDFFPETYRLDLREEREMYFENYIDGEIWISKPTGMNQGKGIFLIRSREEIARLQEKMADIEEDVQSTRKLPYKIPMARIVQRYVTNPLLLDGKKFDVRNYMLISSTTPFVVFYGDGYCRLTCQAYDERSTDLTGHLTNQFMQKKNPLYQEIKEETVWSMDRFSEYVNQHHMDSQKLPQDWVHTVLRKRCQQIMLHCFQAVRHKLECKSGFFDLYGCDFLVDDEFKVYLLEFNCNPALHTNCDLLKEVIPTVVRETLKLALEIHAKTKCKEKIMPLASQEHFVLIYNGDLIEAEERREKLKSAAEARKRARSAQRRKKFAANYNTRYSLQGRRESLVEGEVTTASSLAVTSATFSAVSTTSITMQKNVSQNSSFNVICHTMTTLPIAVSSRSHTSFSNMTTHLQYSPPITQSHSMPNVSQKRPFYAGGALGSVPSRPYSAPRFQRNKHADGHRTSVMHSQPKNKTNRNEKNNEENVTEASVAASLNAKVNTYKRSVPAMVRSNAEKRHNSLKDSENVLKINNHNPNKGSREEKLGDLCENDVIGEIAGSEYGSDSMNDECQQTVDDFDNNDETAEGRRTDKQTNNVASLTIAMQAPYAQLPQNYHSKVEVDNEFSKRYLASFAKRSNKVEMPSTTMKVFKTPLPSALSYLPPSDTSPYLVPSSEKIPQQKKVQYRTPTTVRIRQMLQATTCTLEIGPNSRRGLVAVPSNAPIVHLVQSPRLQASKTNTTKLRMMNVPGPIVSPAPEDSSEIIPGIRISFNDPQIQISQKELDKKVNAGQSINQKRDYRFTSVDSSTQTPVSNSTMSSEEKVIWRLRTRIGANNAGNTNRIMMSNPEQYKSTSKSQNSLSPRYIAVRPTLTTGVTLAISPPAVLSGKNLLPSIQESRGSTDLPSSESACSSPCNTGANPSRHSQTCPIHTNYELSSGTTVKTLLDSVSQVKYKIHSDKWSTNAG